MDSRYHETPDAGSGRLPGVSDEEGEWVKRKLALEMSD